MAEIKFQYPLSGDEDTDYEEEKDDSEDDREFSGYDYTKDDTDCAELIFHNEDVEILSLQNLCLKSIARNFNRFNTAYVTSEDTALRRNLLFLQRAYSDRMISEMKVCINDSCLNFLLNEHLKEFHLEMFFKCSDEAILKRLSEIGHGFVKVYLNCSPTNFATPPLVEQAVALFPNVHTLHVPFFCTNDLLKVIASSCPKLQELYIHDSSVSDEGLKSLFKEKDGVFQARCPLKTLSIKNTKVDDSGVTFLLQNMPSLQILNHSRVPVALFSMHKNDLGTNTGKKYNLTTLDLMSSEHIVPIDLSDILSVCAAVCPHVTKLSSPVACPKHLDLISMFSKCENLTLEGTSETNLSTKEFLKSCGGKLKELKLSYFSVSALVLLQSCPKLESLNLRDITFQWEDKDENADKPYLNHLRKLSLEHFIFMDLAIEKSVGMILIASPNLELVDMAHCELADSGFHEKLSNFCTGSSLRSLQFNCSDIDIELLECVLLTCSSLHTLVIDDCENIHSDNITSLYDIIHSKKQKVKILWRDQRSELNSSMDDFFDNYDFSGDSDDYFYPASDYDCDFDFATEDYCGSDY